MIRALLFFSACLCTCWLLLAGTTQAHDPNEPLGAPLADASPPTMPEPRVARAVARGSEASATDVDSRETTEPLANEEPGSEVEPQRSDSSVVGNLAAPIPYVAKRLGLSRDDARLAFLSDWLADRRTEEHRLTERVSQSGGAEQREAMQAFNDAGDTWRRMLVQHVGYDLASQVLATFCMYRFDAAEGSWHRVDVAGERVPFLHEDDDIWQRGESSNPGWEGHW